MSKRLILLLTLLVMTVSTVAHAQDTTPLEPVFVLSEAQINDEFTIPDTATYTISNLVVDVRQDEIHISFDMTSIQDGTSNTMSIIAILIGLVQVDGQQYFSFKDVLVSQLSAPARARREIARLVLPAWRSYLNNAFAGVDVSADHIDFVEMLMEEEGISYY
jgi:hypothetical protein